MGGLQVQLLHDVGNDPDKEGQLHQVKYMSPFAGQTSIDYVSEEDDYNNTQKSYGMWAIPPDVGNTVVVIFINGDPKKGYWIGCVQDRSMNFSMPGYASTSFNIDGTEERVPVAEYNKKTQASALDPTQIKKPVTPQQDVLASQGLLKDDIRGITTSSARREIPSAVFGISTPGPVDKQTGAKQGPIGKAEHKIANAFVSRLGGSSFVMDDGDDKFLRKTSASEGPPVYAAVEQNEEGGDVTIPHNELVRIRTRTGHQILLHNSEDLIYIGNAKGTTWIELTSNGKIDIYAEDSISIHTQQDLNFKADRDINFEAGRNVNVKSTGNYIKNSGNEATGGRIQFEAASDYNLIVGANNSIRVAGDNNVTIDGSSTVNVNSDFNLKVAGSSTHSADGDIGIKASGNNNFTADGNTNINSGGNHLETASQIHMNGPGAATAGVAATAVSPIPLTVFENPGTADSIMKRIPTHEPWEHHENLDPANFAPDITDRETNTSIATPDAWNSYSTVTDTFAKIAGSE
jgi:uncharacterized protein (DUF2345 family)